MGLFGTLHNRAEDDFLNSSLESGKVMKMIVP